MIPMRAWSAALVLGLLPTSTAAQSPPGDTAARRLIENALRAAPAAVSDAATVTDGKGKVLRQGTNGWVCIPDDPQMPNETPMCLDATWQRWMEALMARRDPPAGGLGIAYMLQGDFPVSNTDPFATGPTPDNQWVENAGPHVMLIVPDAAAVASLPTDPKNGGPWVMWKGTKYAHVMVPVPQRTP